MSKLPLIIGRIAGWFFLLLFASYFAGVNYFPHTHLVDNHLVTHSHPFSPAENHQHSTTGFELINQLSGIITTSIAFAFIFFLFRPLIARLDSLNLIVKAFSTSDSYIFLRPPPVA